MRCYPTLTFFRLLPILNKTNQNGNENENEKKQLSGIPRLESARLLHFEGPLALLPGDGAASLASTSGLQVWWGRVLKVENIPVYGIPGSVQ